MANNSPVLETDPWRDLRGIIMAAKGDGRTLRSWSWTTLAERASFLPGAPPIDGDAVRQALNKGLGAGAFSWGPQIRAVAAVLGIPLVDLLIAGRWWPDMRWVAMSPQDRVAEGLRLMGLEVVKVTSQGKRVVVDLR